MNTHSQITNGHDQTMSLHGGTPVQATRDHTGETVHAAGVSLEALQKYTRARHRRPALRMAVKDRLEAAAQLNPALGNLLAELAICDEIIESTEVHLGQAFAPAARAAGTLRLEVPGLVDVTWPRPARRWIQRVTPEQITREDPDLAERLGIEQVHSAPARPIIKLGDPAVMPSGRPTMEAQGYRGPARRTENGTAIADPRWDTIFAG